MGVGVGHRGMRARRSEWMEVVRDHILSNGPVQSTSGKNTTEQHAPQQNPTDNLTHAPGTEHDEDKDYEEDEAVEDKEDDNNDNGEDCLEFGQIDNDYAVL